MFAEGTIARIATHGIAALVVLGLALVALPLRGGAQVPVEEASLRERHEETRESRENEQLENSRAGDQLLGGVSGLFGEELRPFGRLELSLRVGGRGRNVLSIVWSNYVGFFRQPHPAGEHTWMIFSLPGVRYERLVAVKYGALSVFASGTFGAVVRVDRFHPTEPFDRTVLRGPAGSLAAGLVYTTPRGFSVLAQPIGGIRLWYRGFGGRGGFDFSTMLGYRWE